MFTDCSSVRGALEFPQNQRGQCKAQKRPEGESQTNEDIIYKDGKKTKQKQKKKLFFKVKTLGRVAQFVNNLKSSAFLNQPVFKASEFPYIYVDESEKEKAFAFIKYENKFFFFLQIICFFIQLIDLWKASFQIVLGRLNDEHIMDYIGLLACLVMIFLNCNIELKNEKLALISEKKKIREEYISNLLPFDVIAILGFILKITPLDEIYEQVFYVSRFFLLLLLVQASNSFGKVIKKLALNRQIESALLILKLVMKVMIFLHVMSLLLNFYAKAEKSFGVQVTWVESNGFSSAKNYEIYIFAWYWSCTIMSTVGFGDIQPASGNPFEAFLVSILEVFCCVVFSYFVNYIGQLLKIFGESKVAYEHEIRRLNNYLRNLKVNDQIRNQARTHLFNKYKTLELFDKHEEDKIREELTEKLQKNLVLLNNRTVLNETILHKNFGDQMMDDLAQHLDKVIYHPEEYIFEGGSSDLSFWIVEDGSILELPEKGLSHQPLSIFNKKKNKAGWINFITGQSYRSWGWTDSFTISYKLKRSDFMKTIKKFSKQLYKFMKMKDSFIEKGKRYESNCLGCGKLSHNVINCPRIHMKPRKIHFILDKKKVTTEGKGQNMRKANFYRREKRIFWFDKNKEKLQEVQKIANSGMKTKKLIRKTQNKISVQQNKEEISLNNRLASLKQNLRKKSLNKRLRSRNQIKSEKSVKYVQDSFSNKSIESYFQSENLIIYSRYKTIFDSVLHEGNQFFKSDSQIEKIIKQYHEYRSKEQMKLQQI